jgi:hypothetical protein
LVIALVIAIEKDDKLTSLAFSFDSTNTVTAGHCVNNIFCRPHRRNRNWSVLSVANDGFAASSPPMTVFHTVQGVLCREVTNELPVIGTVVVLEATADAQEELVDECLELEEDNEGDGTQKRIVEGDPYGCV